MSRRAGRGTLSAIMLLFAASASIRFGDGLGLAIARAAETVPEEASAQGAQDCGPAPVALAAALSEREARALALEISLADRAAALDQAEKLLEGRLEAIEQAEKDLRATLALADGAAEADLARLTTVYERMKPRDAAPLFDAMDPGFAAGFLGRMRPDAAGAVLAGMQSDRAWAVSAILAGRNARAPKD